MQGCAFWESRWWIITVMGPKFPKTPIFFTWIGISSQICKKNQTVISSDLCIRLTWNLTGSCGQQQGLREWFRMVVKQFQDGRRPPFWKSIYRHISVKNHPIFMTWSKNEKLAFDTLWVRQNVVLVLKQLHCCPRLMYASTLPRSNWLRRASIRLVWYRHMPASSYYYYLRQYRADVIVIVLCHSVIL